MLSGGPGPSPSAGSAPGALVWQLVLPWLRDQADRLAVRAVCRDAAAVVDGCPDSAVRALNIAASMQPIALHTPRRLASGVRHLQSQGYIGTPAHWLRLLALASQLPALTSLRCCEGRRTWLPRPADSGSSSGSGGPVPPPSTYVLHALRVASFSDGVLTSLAPLAELAPNLQQLWADRLALAAAGERERGAAAASLSGVLPACTHFGGGAVALTAQDELDAGAVFAAALPRLAVLAMAPTFTLHALAQRRAVGHVLPLACVLRACSGITALRGFGSSTAMGGRLPLQLCRPQQQLRQLNRLSLVGDGPLEELLGLGRLTALHSISLSFELRSSKEGMPSWRATALLTELRRLAQTALLRRVGLPAKLLCGRCCRPRAGEGDPQLSALQQLLSALAGQAAGGCEVVFLVRPRDPRRRRGDECAHCSLDELRELAAHAGADAGVDEATRGRLLRVEELPTPAARPDGGRPSLAGSAAPAAAGVDGWGAFGPGSWWG